MFDYYYLSQKYFVLYTITRKDEYLNKANEFALLYINSNQAIQPTPQLEKR